MDANPAHSDTRLLRLSVHASVKWEADTNVDEIVSSQYSWPGKIITGFGQWLSNRKRNTNVQPVRSMVVSGSGNYIAIIDGYQINFLSRANGFSEPFGYTRSSLETGFYIYGIWIQESNMFAVLTSLNCIVVFDVNGKELSRASIQRWKANSYAIAMFVQSISTSEKNESYTLAVLASDCTLHLIEYGSGSFCDTSTRTISLASLKNIYPEGLICCDFNLDKSILAVAGHLKTNNRGCYRLSLWKIKEFFKSLDLLESIDLEGNVTGMSSRKSVKLIMSPTCQHICFIDSGSKLRLVHMKQSPVWTLQEIQNPYNESGGKPDDVLTEGEAQYQNFNKKQMMKFSCFEVSRCDRYNCQKLEAIVGVRDACWWTDDTFAVLKENGSFALISLYGLSIVSQFRGEFTYDKIHINDGPRKSIFILEVDEMDQIQPMENFKHGKLRLISFQEYTPMELFQNSLQNSEFEFALLLADLYNLNQEVVYKQRWLQSTYELQAVEENLPKIKDKDWVLKECLQRVCPTLDAMNKLLHHGLSLVDLSISSGGLELATADVQVGRLCLVRLRLLQHYDRLETYLGINMDRYSAKDYRIFRGSPLPDVAVRFAESGKIGALCLLFKRHVYSLSPHLFKILNAIPETVAPYTYAQLLPQLGLSDYYSVGREKDWVEEDAIVDLIQKRDISDMSVSPVDLRESTEHVVKAFIGYAYPSEDEITVWYQQRTMEIDKVSGQLENALALLDLGKQRGCKNLEDLWEDLSILHWVIYNRSEANDDYAEISLSLESWQQFDNYDKFELMLRGANETNVLDRLREKAIPFMKRKGLGKHPSGKDPDNEQESLLVMWMKDVAKKNQLQICDVIIMEECKASNSRSLFDSEIECIKTGLDCVYACTRMDQWDLMTGLLSKLSMICLHARSQEEQRPPARRKTIPLYNRSPEVKPLRSEQTGNEILLSALEKKIQQSIGHVEAGRLLSQYQVPKPIRFFETAQNDERMVKQLIILILSKFSRRQPARSDSEWAAMWDDLQKLQSKAFGFLNKQFLFLEYYRGLLKAGKFYLAKSQLRGVGHGLLSVEKAESIIIQVAREYFYAASSLDSPEIEKARLCLNLLPSSKNIAAEIGLIDAVTIKLPALGVSLLPMQVKQVKDPMDIVKKALMCTSTSGDLKVDDLLDIARLLGMTSDDHLAMVEEAIAREAAASGQITSALDLCLSLMKRSYGPIWDLCAALARGPEVEGLTLKIRKELLGFALGHCDEASIGQLLNSWKEIDLSMRYAEIKKASILDYGDSTEDEVKINGTVKPLEEGSLKGIYEESFGSVALSKPVGDSFSRSFLSKERRKMLRHLIVRLPELLQTAGGYSEWKKQFDCLSSKSVSAILLGLAHGGIVPNDELICHLAQAAMSDISEWRSLVACGYLLNLTDCQKGVQIFEKELQHREEAGELCEILKLAFKYGALQHDEPGNSSSPIKRRERMLKILTQSLDVMESNENIAPGESRFWKQWQASIMQELNMSRHALELAPFVPKFKMDEFINGHENYLNQVIMSMIKSAMVLEHPDSAQESRVDRYKASGNGAPNADDEHCILRISLLVKNFNLFKKYLRLLDLSKRYIAIQAVLTITSKMLIENYEKGFFEDNWRTTLLSLIQFWVDVANAALEDVDVKQTNTNTMKALLDVRRSCRNVEMLVRTDQIKISQAQDVISKLNNLWKGKDIVSCFVEAMVSSGCSFQAILLLGQASPGESPDIIEPPVIFSEIKNLYEHVVRSSIQICRVSTCFDESGHQLEGTIKAVSSLSKIVEAYEERWQHDANHLLQEVRSRVWELIGEFSEDSTVPATLRVCLVKLREAIIPTRRPELPPDGFEGYLQAQGVMWNGWDITSVAGETTSSTFQHTIVALKSTELITSIWTDTIIQAGDLASVDIATDAFNRLVNKVESPQHAGLLVNVLEEWEAIYGWETPEESIDSTNNEDESSSADNADWGQSDGWDVWDDNEEPIQKVSSKDESMQIHLLHACWKAIFEKLVLFGYLEKTLQVLDRVQTRSGKTLLTKEESSELISCLSQENPVSSLKVSLLLPYKDVRRDAVEEFADKISRILSKLTHETEDSAVTNVRFVFDDCLLTLLLASGQVSDWAENTKFSMIFSILCAGIMSSVQAAPHPSSFILEVVLPSFIAIITPTSKYTVASALVLHFLRVHPAFVTWNGAYVALENYLTSKKFQACNDELDAASLDDSVSLHYISNTVSYLESELRGTLDSALKFLSKLSL